MSPLEKRIQLLEHDLAWCFPSAHQLVRFLMVKALETGSLKENEEHRIEHVEWTGRISEK